MKIELNCLREALGLSLDEVMDRCNNRFTIEDLDEDNENPKQVIYVYA